MSESFSAAGQNGKTKQPWVISYKTIQGRMDKMYEFNWFNPTAFYPTGLCFAVNDIQQENVANLFNKITFDKEKPLDPRFESNKNDGQNAVVNSITSGFANVLEACEYEYKSIFNKLGAYGSETGFSGEPDKDLDKWGGSDATPEMLSDDLLCTIQKIDGLQFPEIPLSIDNGRIKADRPKRKSGKISICFALTDYVPVMSFIGRWQSEWMAYNSSKRVLRAHHGGKTNKKGHFGEGYLGMDYIHIFPNGNIDRIGHLFVGGIIPLKMTIENSSFGPQASQPSGIPVLKLECIYAQACLGIGSAYGEAQKARWYFFD